MSVSVGNITLYSGDIIRLLDQHTGNYLKRVYASDSWFSGSDYQFIAAELPPPRVNDEGFGGVLASLVVFVNEDKSISLLADNKTFLQAVFDKNLSIVANKGAYSSDHPTRRFNLESGGGDIVFLRSQHNNKYVKTVYTGKYNLTCPLGNAIEYNLGKYRLFKIGVFSDVKEEIISIKYDFDKAVKSLTPTIVGRGEYRNPTDATLTDQLSASEEVTTTKSFEFGAGFSFGVSYTTSVGVPLVAEAEFTVSAEISFTFTHSTSTENKKATLNALGISVPPHSNIRAFYEIKKGVCNVPFVAEIRRVDLAGKEYRFAVAGTYEGVNVSDSSIRTEKIV